MAIPPDPTGGYAARMLQEMFVKNRQAATEAMKDGIKTTARTIKSNPRVVQQVMKTGGQTAVRAAGLSVGEATVAVGTAEALPAAPSATAVVFGLSAVELIVLVAAIIFVVCLVYSWSQMDPVSRGYRGSFDNSEAKEQLMAMGEEGPVRGMQRGLQRRGLPIWMKQIATQV